MRTDLEKNFLTALEENQQKLLRICSVYAKDRDDTKDLFQEVLVNIWRSMPSFKGNSSLGTWMYRIALNVCLRIQTKHNKKRARFIRMDSITIGAMKSNDDHNEKNEHLIQLKNCIKRLNEADIAVITLYLEELPYKEISTITGLTENNVAVKIKRIKTKLLNCINEIS